MRRPRVDWRPRVTPRPITHKGYTRMSSHEPRLHTKSHDTWKQKGYALRLNALPLLPHELRDMRNLDGRVRLDDPEEVLLEEVVVQRREVRADRWVRREFYKKG